MRSISFHLLALFLLCLLGFLPLSLPLRRRSSPLAISLLLSCHFHFLSSTCSDSATAPFLALLYYIFFFCSAPSGFLLCPVCLPPRLLFASFLPFPFPCVVIASPRSPWLPVEFFPLLSLGNQWAGLSRPPFPEIPSGCPRSPLMFDGSTMWKPDQQNIWK